ncbi:DUF4255 domain-containing protein [Actinosynnema pretiosum subsp. pretiosum]|uniref:Pvc16 N-terminal domain-containing protein n=2 Tax=Actinosynnema TaxID=40566 RepID=C6WRL1_ACTMD|nr:DUF4255 domain-containing protein [Actinosynnema mirum]ACU36853.1 hypothetical protein Amir_2932 [Actinosynnema mirum DSM 43827]AXX30322.1 hypothetical protein APASM_2957 [Actinosynnema pretiosum subsp. pretiosum]QUF05522.1 DUF4255 domain-containing protein [Actinosynnema pretiosum subsp. pretiosum]
MIHEVDEAIRRLLSDSGVPGGGGELAFEAPSKEWTARRNGPMVNVFLYDIREDVGRRSAGAAEVHDESGDLLGWRGPTRWFRLSYLVTAWTNRATDEHRLLSEVLACLVRVQSVERRWLTGSLAELGAKVPLITGGALSEGAAAADVWSALGGELKPSIDVKVTAPMRGEWTPAGPPVTEGIVLRGLDEPGFTGDGTARRLRYEGPSSAEGEGFAATRERPVPTPERPAGTARKRRGGAIR